MDKLIRLLVIPNDRWGCGFFRCLQPHQYIQKHYGDKFDVEIRYNIPNDIPLEKFFRRFDVVHIHKQLDNEGNIAKIIKECGCKLVVDIDDHWTLGPDHPMRRTSKKRRMAHSCYKTFKNGRCSYYNNTYFCRFN